MKEQIEHEKLRAIAQILLDKESGVKAFDEYIKTAFPWHKTAQERHDRAIKEMMEKEFSRGPIVVTPQIVGSPTSKLYNKMVSRDPLKAPVGNPEVYKRIDRVGSKFR